MGLHMGAWDVVEAMLCMCVALCFIPVIHFYTNTCLCWMLEQLT